MRKPDKRRSHERRETIRRREIRAIKYGSATR